VDAATLLNGLNGTTSLAPIIGAFLSDAYLGRYLALAIASVASLIVSPSYSELLEQIQHFHLEFQLTSARIRSALASFLLRLPCPMSCHPCRAPNLGPGSEFEADAGRRRIWYCCSVPPVSCLGVEIQFACALGVGTVDGWELVACPYLVVEIVGEAAAAHGRIRSARAILLPHRRRARPIFLLAVAVLHKRIWK
jgi:hypothetical protein